MPDIPMQPNPTGNIRGPVLPSCRSSMQSLPKTRGGRSPVTKRVTFAPAIGQAIRRKCAKPVTWELRCPINARCASHNHCDCSYSSVAQFIGYLANSRRASSPSPKPASRECLPWVEAVPAQNQIIGSETFGADSSGPTYHSAASDCRLWPMSRWPAILYALDKSSPIMNVITDQPHRCMSREQAQTVE